MKKFKIILNSTILLVLFCILDTFSLPLTRTSYTLPENKIDLSLREEFIYIENMNRRDNFSLNLGLPGNTSIGFDFSLINYTTFEIGDSIPGDILFNIWHFTGDYFDGTVNSGINLVLRIPTGPDAYISEKSRNLAFGNNEIKITPVLSFNLSDFEVLSVNLSYTFREGRGEDLYSGFKFNLLKSETYKAGFGLNPFYEESFFEGKNLKNDYSSVAGGLITSRLYPWIFFAEIYYSTRLDQGGEYLSNISIEGDQINPLLLSMGAKYSFSDSFFVLVSGMVNLLNDDGYIKNTTEFSLNIFF